MISNVTEGEGPQRTLGLPTASERCLWLPSNPWKHLHPMRPPNHTAEGDICMPRVTSEEVNYNDSDLKNECGNCGGTDFRIKAADSVHHGEQKCTNCGRHIKFIPRPRDGRGRSSAYSVKDVAEHHGYDEHRCFFCRRTRSQLGKNETLEVDHIKELEKENGEDGLNNVQILCTPCHKLKNWMRLYNNWHRSEFFGETAKVVRNG